MRWTPHAEWNESLFLHNAYAFTIWNQGNQPTSCLLIVNFTVKAKLFRLLTTKLKTFHCGPLNQHSDNGNCLTKTLTESGIMYFTRTYQTNTMNVLGGKKTSWIWNTSSWLCTLTWERRKYFNIKKIIHVIFKLLTPITHKRKLHTGIPTASALKTSSATKVLHLTEHPVPCWAPAQ